MEKPYTGLGKELRLMVLSLKRFICHSHLLSDLLTPQPFTHPSFHLSILIPSTHPSTYLLIRFLYLTSIS